MARLPYVTREKLGGDDQKLWDDIARRRGGMPKNYQVLLNNPQAAAKLAVMGGYLRFETSLGERIQSLATLASARAADGHYVWAANLKAARQAGIADQAIKAIRNFRASQELDPEDAEVVQLVSEMFQRHQVSVGTFERVRSRIGDRGIIDLLLLAAFYYGLACVVQALEVELPEGVPSDLLLG